MDFDRDLGLKLLDLLLPEDDEKEEEELDATDPIDPLSSLYISSIY